MPSIIDAGGAAPATMPRTAPMPSLSDGSAATAERMPLCTMGAAQ